MPDASIIHIRDRNNPSIVLFTMTPTCGPGNVSGTSDKNISSNMRLVNEIGHITSAVPDAAGTLAASSGDERFMLENEVLRMRFPQVLLATADSHLSLSLSLVIACGVIVALVALLLITHHPVREPKRALIFRLATLHRVSGPGYVFVLPFFEHIEDELHMGLREMQVEVPLGLPGDPLSNLAHLDITWRIHPAVRGRPPSPVHDILLESDELRGKLVRESVARAAGWVLIEYSHDDLTIPAARESIAHTIACTANAELTPCGLLVERIYWRA